MCYVFSSVICGFDLWQLVCRSNFILMTKTVVMSVQVVAIKTGEMYPLERIEIYSRWRFLYYLLELFCPCFGCMDKENYMKIVFCDDDLNTLQQMQEYVREYFLKKHLPGETAADGVKIYHRVDIA